MAASVLKALKTRYNGRSSKHQTDLELACNSIELMRVNIQESFDKEINVIINKFLQTYFRPAIRNIKENLDNSVLTDDFYFNISCDLLENAKYQYATQAKYFKEIFEDDPSKNESDGASKPKTLKRKNLSSSDDDSSSSQSSTPHHSTPKKPAMAKEIKLQSIVHNYDKRPFSINDITEDTLFVLDYKVNRALGLVDSCNEHFYRQHPDLMRYQTDNNDKEWLIKKRILSPAHKRFRILLMLRDDVYRIAKENQYKSRGKLNLNELVGFKISEFMLHKMRATFRALQTKRQKEESKLKTASYVTQRKSSSELEDNCKNNQTVPTYEKKEQNVKKSSLSSTHATLTALLSGTKDKINSSNSAPKQ